MTTKQTRTHKRTAAAREGRPECTDGKIYDQETKQWIDGSLEVVDLVKYPDREIQHEHTGNQLIKYLDSENRAISISRYYLAAVANASLTNQHFAVAMETCIRKKLNPVTDIAIWVDKDNKMSLHIKDEAFMRRANRHPDYRGFTAGWIISAGEGKGLKYIEHGTDIDAGYLTVGAWCHVIRENRTQPKAEAMINDYARSRDKAYSVWSLKTQTMIAKVARHMAHRLAFPEELSGIYTETEMESTIEVENVAPGAAEDAQEALGDQLADAFTGNPEMTAEDDQVIEDAVVTVTDAKTDPEFEVREDPPATKKEDPFPW